MHLKMKKSDIPKFFFYLFLLLPFFELEFFTLKIGSLDKIYFLWQLVTFFLVGFLVMKKKKYSKIINYIAFFLIILLLSTMVAHGDLYLCFRRILKIITPCLIVDYGLRCDQNSFLKTFLIFLTFLNIFNFFTLIWYPEGMYINAHGFSENWFLGYKNSHILYLMPWLMMSFLDSYERKGVASPFCIFTLVISTLSVIVTNSSTGILGMMLIWIFLIFSKIFQKTKIFNARNYVVFHLSLFGGIVLLRIQNWFSFLLVDILHKDLSFTGRVDIWDGSLKEITSNLWLGYGNISYQFSQDLSSCHNQILGILYKTGLVGLLAFGMLLHQCLKQMKRYKEYKSVQFLAMILFIYFMMMLMEEYQFEYFMYLFVFFFHCDHFLYPKEVSNQ